MVWKMNNLFEKIDLFVKLASLFSGNDVLAKVKQIHHTEEDFTEGNLTERILKFKTYVLMELPIAKVSLGKYSVYDDVLTSLIENHKEDFLSGNYPPIVYDPEEEDIIDGTHRVEALERLGIASVKAFVGKEKE